MNVIVRSAFEWCVWVLRCVSLVDVSIFMCARDVGEGGWWLCMDACGGGDGRSSMFCRGTNLGE